MRVLVSGASVGGPVLAYWLRGHGHDVTVVERAPAPRRGSPRPGGLDPKRALLELQRKREL